MNNDTERLTSYSSKKRKKNISRSTTTTTQSKIGLNFIGDTDFSSQKFSDSNLNRGLKKVEGEGEVQRVINTRFKEMSKINLRNEFAIELLARFLSLIFYPWREGEGELFCRTFGVITGNPVAGTPRGMEEHRRRPPPLLIHVSSFRRRR